MAEITKKCDKEYFDKILSGEKKFEIRLANDDYNSGDMLILKESIKGKETGRAIKKKIGFLLKTKDLTFWNKEDIDKYGFIVIQLEDIK